MVQVAPYNPDIQGVVVEGTTTRCSVRVRVWPADLKGQALLHVVTNHKKPIGVSMIRMSLFGDNSELYVVIVTVFYLYESAMQSQEIF